MPLFAMPLGQHVVVAARRRHERDAVAAQRRAPRVTMSPTVSATCCTPSPRSSSLKMLICELLKNGRDGSLFANFTFDAGSHITIDLRPEPVLRSGSTSLVWNSTSQSCSKPEHVLEPQQHRLHGLEVRRDVIDLLEAELVLAAALVRRPRRGTAPCSRGARGSGTCVSPNGVVIENWRSVPPSSVNVWMSSIGVPPRSSSSWNVRSMSSTSKISVPTPSGCFDRKRAARPPVAERRASTRR